MIVIGSPLLSLADTTPRAAGLADAISRAAAAEGAAVEMVGRIGEDAAGEAILLDLAAAGIGHVAMIRDAGQPTGSWAPEPEPDAFGDPDSVADDKRGSSMPDTIRPTPLDAEDIDLALRYLPEYRVIVVVDALSDSALGAAAAAAKWAGAALVLVVAEGSAVPTSLDPAATVFEAPADDDGAFARLVGGYAAALDRGDDPAEAFAAATGGMGWARAGE